MGAGRQTHIWAIGPILPFESDVYGALAMTLEHDLAAA